MLKKMLRHSGIALLIVLLNAAVTMAFELPGKHTQTEEFNFSGKAKAQVQFFKMESKLINYAPDGKRTGITVFRLQLKAEPAVIAGTKFDRYTCLKFTMQEGENGEIEIPQMRNWQHEFISDGMQAKQQVFGIEHSEFENLTDANGQALPPDKSYHVYNAFIDFHAFVNVFGQPTTGGNGVQHLTHIGDRIVHAAANSKPPVNLGSNIKEGSYFQNGEITLGLKGTSVIDGDRCALLDYDSGESSFKMAMESMPNFEVNTAGSSHYFGDIYKDLQTNWVRKATMKEFVVSETTLPAPPNKINSVVERVIVIKNIPQHEMQTESTDKN